MNSFSLGDLAQTFMLQRRGAALKAEMARLNEEVATGQVSDIKSVLDGNVAYLTDIERNLKSLQAYRVATSEAAQFTDAVQLSLERIDTSVGSLGATLLTKSANAIAPILDQFAKEAESELATIVSALNTTSAGRALFGGNATDQSPVEGVEPILTGLRVAVAGLTSTQDIIDAADLWFNDPAGFTAVVYNGGDSTLEPFRLGNGETVSSPWTANDPILRDTLKNVALAAISDDIILNDDTRRALLQDTGGALIKSQGELVTIRANVGTVQARIDALTTRNATEESALLIAKGALVRADPFDAATELEAVQFQLQSLYAITARMSDMSFVNFIR